VTPLECFQYGIAWGGAFVLTIAGLFFVICCMIERMEKPKVRP